MIILISAMSSAGLAIIAGITALGIFAGLRNKIQNLENQIRSLTSRNHELSSENLTLKNILTEKNEEITKLKTELQTKKD